MMVAPESEQLNPAQPEGTYQIDAFFDLFTPRTPSRKAEPLHKQKTASLTREEQLELTHEVHKSELTPQDQSELRNEGLNLFRWDVIRLVVRARRRTDRDENEIPQARRSAAELMGLLQDIQPALDQLVELGDLAIVAAELKPVFEAKPVPGGVDVPEPHGPVGYIVRALESAQQLQYCADRLEQTFRLVPWSRNVEPLAKHLAALAVELHEQRLAKTPPAYRAHWLSEFLVTVCRDFKLPDGGRIDDAMLAEHFGGKIEEILRARRHQG
jgi:hypothetical protein